MLCLIHLIHKGYWDTLGIPHVFAGKSMAMFELSEVSFGFFIRKPHLTFEMAGRIQWIHTSSNPPKKENRNLSPKQIILFQYQTTDPLFFRKHLFNGFLLVQTTQQVNLKPPEFCKSIVIWFGFFSVRGCDLHLMGCSRSLVYEGSGSQCVSDSKEISKVIKAATFFFVRCVDVVLFWKHVLSLKFLSSCFFHDTIFVRLVGSFHESEYEMGMTSYVLNMLNLPQIPNIPIWKASWLALRTTFGDDECEVQTLIWGSFRSVR